MDSLFGPLLSSFSYFVLRVFEHLSFDPRRSRGLNVSFLCHGVAVDAMFSRVLS